MSVAAVALEPHNSRRSRGIRRWLGSLICATAALVASVAADGGSAQAYPTRPVRIVVPFAAGSSTDALARLLAEELRQAFGGAFVIENKAGASGLIAADDVARSTADGHVLFVATNTTHSANPSLFRRLPYDPVRDFTAISRLTSGQFILIVNPSLRATSVGELIETARARPGLLTYATPNSTSLVSAELFKALARVDILSVPYRNAGNAFTDVVSGQVSLMFGDQANAVPLIQGGQVRGLAVTGDRRSTLVPDLPTMAEAGVEGFAVNSWAGLFGPAGMPVDLVARINAHVRKALSNPEFGQRLRAIGYEPTPSTPEEFRAFVAAEVGNWAAAIAKAGIQPQ